MSHFSQSASHYSICFSAVRTIFVISKTTYYEKTICKGGALHLFRISTDILYSFVTSFGGGANSPFERVYVDSVVYSNRSIDSLSAVADRFTADYLQIKVDALDQGEIYRCALDRRDITRTTVLENGKMYRLSAELNAVL